jgi:DNA-binding PadR family transcriptional regulator
MRSLNRVGTQPMSLPLSADDIVEFHAARLMLLMLVCGVRGRIDGLTKMAKLDFFARYPDFFEAARAAVVATDRDRIPSEHHLEAVESAMVRHHYGPWDKRYYHVLAHLEAKRLITVSKEGRSYRIALTELGRERAEALAARPSFAPLVQRMREVKKTFGGKTGSSLKGLIYRLFEEEVGRRKMGETISR